MALTGAEEQRDGDFGHSTLLIEIFQNRLQGAQALVKSICLADKFETYWESNVCQSLTNTMF